MEIIEKYFVEDFFKDKPIGKFLEIGADNGGLGSDAEPMWGLVEKGWFGVYCEPNPISCAKLIENSMPYRDQIKIFNGAISLDGTSKLEDFYLSLDFSPISSLDKQWADKIGNPVHMNKESWLPIITNTIDFQRFIDKVGNDFDCISIDIENESSCVDRLIMSIDWAQFKNCKLLCIETTKFGIEDYLKTFGFDYILETKNNNCICIKS
jgi:hypothetical protein